ncbi:DNA polymerase [Erwinia phage vB_EamM_Asesino]|uniref:T4-like DNA polymerase n=1 Tax=Erwinia phage vB_EamM_Asesino TaxID=1883370 RepID=A0A1B2IA18_9CAUD|nr:DNA polymerase [Erwinia phage vB_EamM_Asesino]ANZ48074.1 hypothetical protein ASESINO_61 [Erwinia phage vB_EamM_Asesino]
MINNYFAPEDVIAKECKHVAYATDDDKQNDFVLVKEVIHTKDGRLIPRVFGRENLKRPIYITQPNHRNHQEKKEYEERSKTQEFMTTDVKMAMTIQAGLGVRFPDPKKRLRQVCTSPYVYWADLPITSWIKQKYLKKYPNSVTPNRLCIYDVETREEDGSRDPWLMSFVLDDEIHFYATKDYLARCGRENFEERLRKRAAELLCKIEFREKNKKTGEEEVKARDVLAGFTIYAHEGVTSGHCIQMMFEEIHPKLPDLMVAWNHEFDISRMLEALARDNIDPADVFCHPSVPKQYRKVWFKKDEASKKTESKSLTKAPSQQWHILYCVASFYFVDAMCLFRSLRVHEGQRPSYKLNAILDSELGLNKLDIPGLPYEEKLEWHLRAQKEYPLEYSVYNIFDNLMILLLDKKTNDLSSAISILAGYSMYDIFPSLPKRICVAFTYYLYEQNPSLVIGCTGQAMRNDFDEEVIGTDGWIVTLTACMNSENGLNNILKEIPVFHSAFRGQTADADLTQAYPSATNMMNQSRETTLIELLSITGVSEEIRRRTGVNLTAGRVNAMEIATDFFRLPDKDQVLTAFLVRQGETVTDPIEYINGF